MSVEKEYFKTSTISNDFFRLIAGTQLGAGCFREVYRCSIDPTMVIKFEVGSGDFNNVAEWDIWSNLKDHPKLGKWLAPCIAISPCGSILLQRYAGPLPDNKLPKKVPAFFTDIKSDNWGLINGRPVCRDYGHHRLYTVGPSARLIKANWR